MIERHIPTALSACNNISFYLRRYQTWAASPSIKVWRQFRMLNVNLSSIFWLLIFSLHPRNSSRYCCKGYDIWCWAIATFELGLHRTDFHSGLLLSRGVGPSSVCFGSLHNLSLWIPTPWGSNVTPVCLSATLFLLHLPTTSDDKSYKSSLVSLLQRCQYLNCHVIHVASKSHAHRGKKQRTTL